MINEALQSRRTIATPLALSPLCLSALLAVAPIPVIAVPPAANAPETAVASVSLTNLDLTTSAGQQAAQDRVVAAVTRLCHKFSDDRKADNYASMQACYTETLAGALQQLNARLAAATAERSQLASNSKEKP